MAACTPQITLHKRVNQARAENAPPVASGPEAVLSHHATEVVVLSHQFIRLQVRVSEYNQLKGQLAALNRKRTGNLAVRELSNLVNNEVSCRQLSPIV